MDATALMNLATGYWPSAALQAGVALGVFPALAKGRRTAGELAGELEAAASHLEPLLDALVGLTLLEKEGDVYALADPVRPWLDPASPTCLLDALRFNGDLYPLWGQLAECVRTGRPMLPGDVHLGPDPERTARFVRGMDSRARVFAPALVEALDLTGMGRLLDVATGGGTFAAALAGAHPELRVTGVDLPAVVEVAQALQSGHPAAPRLTWCAADYHRDPLPSGADAVLYCGALHQESREQAASLLTSFRRAMRPGGRLFVVDLCTGRDGTTPVFSALFGLSMALTRPAGGVYTSDDVVGLLRAAGFVPAPPRQIEGTPYTLVEGRLSAGPAG